MTAGRHAGAAAVALLLTCASGAARATGAADEFREAGAWKASASDQVRAAARPAGPGGGLCLDYDFAGVAGYAVLRRERAIEYPENYAFELRLRGTGPANDLQFKLVDASGENVWWHVRPGHAFVPGGERLRIRKRQLSFAWGPATDRRLRATAAIEVAVVAARGGGGKGSVCFERLALEELPPASATPPAVVATASAGGDSASRAFDGDATSAWRGAAAGAPWLRADLGALREFNGVSLRWLAGARAADYDLEASVDGRRWRTLRRVRGGAGDFDALFLPESEARFLRLRLRRGPGREFALAEVAVHDAAQWPDLNAVVAARAANAPRGRYPRAWLGEQNYWTLVGVDGGGARSALLSEDGAVESAPGGFSVEPFVRLADGTVVSWADVRIEQRLRDGYLPVPGVRWMHPRFRLDIEAAAQDTREESRALVRYELRGTDGPQPTLVLAARPLQVNPPQQFLAVPGGTSAIRTLAWDGTALRVNGRDALRPTRAPDAAVASPGDGGPAIERLGLRGGARPFTLADPSGLASAAFAFGPPPHGGANAVTLVLPLAGEPERTGSRDDAWARAQLDAVAQGWRGRLERTRLRLPAKAARLRDSLRTAQAHMLMSRDGPALQPGTRSYARTWVRDGAMMVAALLRLGEAGAAVEFVDWYAGRLFASGKVPCCVDSRGADPVAENDSHGQFVHAVALAWRYTGDAGVIERHWPKVAAATRYMESLRQSERVPANREGARASWWGLMPASISHEGYSARPMHSYWDDFWALRGYKDAAAIALALGRTEEAREFARWRDEFAQDLAASIRVAVAHHGIGHVPGAAELGDFDATSTTVVLDPAQAQALLPSGLLEATFERYWQEASARAEGRRAWTDYTPYELRAVGALARLGQPARAHAMLDFLFRDQRPAGWNQWAEVVAPDARLARFLGDMPHAWVSSDFVRSALDLLAYDREADGALVIGAGIPDDWLDAGGVAVDGLRTPHGPLTFAARRDGGVIVLEVPAMAQRPPGGLVVGLPALARAARVLVDGVAAGVEGGELRLARLPARVEIDPR